MTQIIAGHFQHPQQVEQAISQLHDSGFSDDKICTFYLNPAGQHDLFPIGGDRDKSPGAKETGHTMTRGAVAGGVIGGAAGIAGVSVVGPVAPVVGAFLGAHIGSFIGSLSGMKESGDTEEENGEENALVQRKAGMIVAVSAEQAANEDDAVEILRASGADQIERADGTITNGNWEDFNPLIAPHLIN